MTETKRQIKELKAVIPYVREKLIAIATMLALSLTMMASVSYAWFTMSTAPEVGSILTQVSSNGNLEVQLATDDGKGNLLKPSESGEGDSFSADGQTTVEANITWGNLINLSNNYGIESLVLRPATFYEGSPAFLTSMTYGEDGRVSGSTNKFDFTAWMKTTDGFSFQVPEYRRFGVRAISTVSYPKMDSNSLQAKLDAADVWNINAINGYAGVVGNEKYIAAIEGLIQAYLDANVASALEGGELKNINCSDYIENLYYMVRDLHEKAYMVYGEALVALANIPMSKNPNYTPYTLETLLAASEEELLANKVALDISMLTMYKSDLGMIAEDAERLKYYFERWDQSQIPVYWNDAEAKEAGEKELEDIIDDIISMSTVQIQDLDGNKYTIGQLMKKGKTELLELTGNLSKNGSAVPIIVNDGLMKDFEQLCGYKMSVEIDFALRYSIILNMGYTGRMRTVLYDSPDPSVFSTDMENTRLKALEESDEEDENIVKVADNTYGMAIDLWVRTNAKNSVLTLDGLVETVTYYALQKIIPSGESTSRQSYIYTYYTGKTVEVEGVDKPESIDIYMFQLPEDLDGDGKVAQYKKTITLNGEAVEYIVYEGYFYDSSTYNKVELRNDKGEIVTTTTTTTNDAGETVEVQVPVYMTHEYYPGVSADETKAVEIKPETYSYYVVTGFSGSNRIDDNYSTTAGQFGATSATQGSGSCYIFYATPEEAEAALKLLEHLKLVFCDASSNKLATAYLAVDYVYADSGKYIVPLVLEPTEHTYTIKNADGTEELGYGITTLEQNEATLISVVVYLDGTKVDNEMVMEKGSIQGNLNIQFGSSEDLSPMVDRDLAYQQITVSASVADTELSFSKDDPNASTTKLTATVTGLSYNSVQAIFRRQINSTQGSVMAPVTLGTDLTADVYFSMPGVYVLKSLWVDGVEYNLPESSWITVKVDGFNVTGVSMVGSDLELTANSYATRDITLSFNESEQPSTVAVRFVDDNGNSVTTTLTKSENNAETWTGTARFTASGHYTMTYVVMDGEDYPLDPTMQEELTAYLGLRAEVALQSVDPDVGLTYPFEGPEEFKIFAYVKTDTGAEMKNLEDLTLYYGRRGSSDPQSGLTAELTWNGTCYVGTFNVRKVGVYNFSQLHIGSSNVISIANRAATISANPKNLPTLQGAKTYCGIKGTLEDDQQAVGTAQGTWIFLNELDGSVGDAYFVVTMQDASGAESYTAIFEDPEGDLIEVTVDSNEANGWTLDNLTNESWTDVYFKIPAMNNDGDRGGEWKLLSVKVTGVYDQNGNFYGKTDDDSLTVVAPYYQMSSTYGFSVLETMSAQVTNTIVVDNTETQDIQFMSAQNLVDSVDGGKITIRVDNLDVELPPEYIYAVSITLKHVEGSEEAMGGYEITSGTPNEATLTFDMEKNADNSWSIPADKVAYLAGTYVVDSVTVTVGTESWAETQRVDYTISSDGITQTDPVLSLYSELPTVTVTGVGTSGETIQTGVGTQYRVYTVSNPTSTDQLIGGDTGTAFSSFTTYGAVVYIQVPTNTGGYDQEAAEACAPTVTLSLTGVPSASTATMTFETSKANSLDSVFVFSNGTATANVGYAVNGERGWFGPDDYPECYPAGLMTQNQIVVTYGGIQYKVSLTETITINQPQYPPYVDFVVNDSLLSTPARIYGTPQADGTFTVTLPTVAYADENKEQPAGALPTDLSTLTPTSTTTSKYATYSGGLINGTWTKYDVQTKVYTVSTSAKTWKVRHQVTGWLYASNTPVSGNTLTITGATTLTAVVDTSYTHSEITETLIYSRTVISYTSVTTASGKSYNTPSGYTKGNPPEEDEGTWIAQN